MWWRLSACMIVLLMLAPATAGERAGGLPTPEENILYIHYLEADQEYFLSNVKDEPGQYIGGRGYGTTCAASPACVPSTDARSWSFPLDPPIADIELDPSQPVHMEAWIGSTSKSGRVTVSAELVLDGTVIAAGDDITDIYNAEYVEFSWDVTPTVDLIPAGSELRWDVAVEGPNTGVYIRMADSPGWSHVVLPIAGNGPLPEVPLNATVHHGVLDQEARIDLGFANATSDTYVYNWSVEAAEFLFSQNVTIVQGALNMSLVSASNETVFATNVTHGNSTSPALALMAGNYTFTLGFTDFIGNVTLQALQAPAASDPAVGDEEPLLDEEGEGGAEEDQKSPGVGLFLVLGLVGAAWARRR